MDLRVDVHYYEWNPEKKARLIADPPSVRRFGERARFSGVPDRTTEIQRNRPSIAAMGRGMFLMGQADFALENPAESRRFAGPTGSTAIGRGCGVRRFVAARPFSVGPSFPVAGTVAAHHLSMAVAFLRRFR